MVHDDELADDGQPHPGAAYACVALEANAVVEDSLSIARRNTRPGIAYNDLGVARRACTRLHADSPATGGELERIDDQVGHDLPQLDRVAPKADGLRRGARRSMRRCSADLPNIRTTDEASAAMSTCERSVRAGCTIGTPSAADRLATIVCSRMAPASVAASIILRTWSRCASDSAPPAPSRRLDP